MFTGIIEELGTITAIDHHRDAAQLRIKGALTIQGTSYGDSIAVNGVCLTVVEISETQEFVVDVMQETLNRSNLAHLCCGDQVNLERAVQLGGRLGGHIVQGHIDATGQILRHTPGEHWHILGITIPHSLSKYIAEKGSIAINGVSLTVTSVMNDYFEVSLIPTTLHATTLGTVSVGELVNIEVDVIAKYLQRLQEH